MEQEKTPVQFYDLITKFYYKQNNLCFQIILNIGNNKMVPYKEFTDYSEYKTAFEKLSKLKASAPEPVKIQAMAASRKTKIKTYA